MVVHCLFQQVTFEVMPTVVSMQQVAFTMTTTVDTLHLYLKQDLLLVFKPLD